MTLQEVEAALDSGGFPRCPKHPVVATFWCPAEGCGAIQCASCTYQGLCRACGGVLRSIGAILLGMKSRKDHS